VFINTGARHDNIVDLLPHADGVIVGSSLKVDGITWNPVDPERVRSFMAMVRRAPRGVGDMARVVVEGLTKRFGRVVAVQDFNLEVAEGELVSLLGPSGCGKTTVLRCIAGFERPDAGRILVDDRVLNDVPPERRGIGMVFQTYALFPI